MFYYSKILPVNTKQKHLTCGTFFFSGVWPVRMGEKVTVGTLKDTDMAAAKPSVTAAAMAMGNGNRQRTRTADGGYSIKSSNGIKTV